MATDAVGSVVLVCEHTDWTLATLLVSRARLAPGEAVTVLAPIATGLATIHAAGYSYGGLTPATVMFSPGGRPVLGDLDALHQLPHDDPGSGRPPPGVVADLRSFASLIAAVAQLVDEPGQSGFTGVADWIAEQSGDSSDSGSLLGQVQVRLFAVAAALPVILVADRRLPSASCAAAGVQRSAGAFLALSGGRATEALSRPRRAMAALAHAGVAGWIRRVMRGRALALGLAIAVLVLTLLAGLAAVPDASPAPTSAASRSGEQAPSARTYVEPATTPTTAGDRGLRSPRLDDVDAVDGEDPLAATVSLLRLRLHCSSDRTATCVAGYAEPGSALADADSRTIGSPARRSELLVGDGAAVTVRIVQSFGDAVFLQAQPANEKRQPVFILTVRTDTGWRLRDVFEPG